MGVLGALWKGYKFGKDSKDLAELGMNHVNLEIAEAVIAEAAKIYEGDKSKNNEDAVRKKIDQIRTVLLKLASPEGKIPTDMKGNAEEMVKTAQAHYARQLLTEIAYLQESGKLPRDPTPWSKRRKIYVNQKNTFTKMAIQFEHAAIRAKRDADKAANEQAEILKIGMTEDHTDEEMKMLEEDSREWAKEEKSARESEAYFRYLAKAAAKVAENAGKILDAGDRFEQSKKK